jgi:hypothetical protein
MPPALTEAPIATSAPDGCLKLGIIVIAMALDGLRQSGDRGRVEPLGQGLFRDRVAETAAAILERMDRLNP